MKTDNSRHFAELDGMRGVLATLVMLMHYGMDRVIAQVTDGSINRCLWELSVDFFFILSGFVLARSYDRSLPTTAGYFIKRFLRLAPMFLLTTIIALGLSHQADSVTIFTNLLIVQSVLGLPSINFPAWSIPFELFIPAVGILVVPTWRRWPHVVVLATAIACVGGATVFCFLLAIGHDIRLFRALFGLGLGFLLFRLVGARLQSLGGRPIMTGVGFSGVLLIMLCGSRLPFLTLGFPLLTSAIIVIGATTNGLMSTRLAQALGRWSYSIYLVHIPVLAIAEHVLGKTAVGHNPGLKIVLAGVSLVTAWLCYRLVEVPFMRFTVSRVPKS